MTDQVPVFGPFISREQARAQGLKRYFMGEPCRHGHIDVRAVSNSHCWTCKTLSNRSPEQQEAQRRYHQRQLETNAEAYRARKAKAMRKVTRNRTPERQEELREYARQWLDNGGREWRQNYEKQLRDEDPQRAIAVRLRNMVGARITRKSAVSLELIGCTVPELMAHLESQFLPGMNWENRHEWHIDHIRPCDSFDLTDPAQQQECFHWSNLQPLWAADNIRKGASLDWGYSGSATDESPSFCEVS